MLYMKRVTSTGKGLADEQIKLGLSTRRSRSDAHARSGNVGMRGARLLGSERAYRLHAVSPAS